MQTLADFLYWAEEYFNSHDLMFGHGTNNAWDEAVAIALYVLNLPPTTKKDILSRTLMAEEKDSMTKLAEKRVKERIPVPYLTREAWFCGEKYYVDERVIIPRSPFAELIKDNFAPWLKDQEIKNILDLCTGSGCIAIACAKTLPDLKVDAIDISEDALEVARYNIKQHKLESRVFALKSDLFQELAGKEYDVIVSNPPYVSTKEHYYLPLEYQYEPKLALISGTDGFDCTREILKKAYDFLAPDGFLFVEVGCNWRALAKKYTDIHFNWLTFSNGGEGVFMLTKKQLEKIKMMFT